MKNVKLKHFGKFIYNISTFSKLLLSKRISCVHFSYLANLKSVRVSRVLPYQTWSTGPPYPMIMIRSQGTQGRHVGSVCAPRQSPDDCDRVNVVRTSHDLNSRSLVSRHRFTFFFLIYFVCVFAFCFRETARNG